MSATTASRATHSPARPVPSHVPPELVHDYDYLADARVQEDIHRGMLDLIEQAPPIFWTPRHGGHWVVTSAKAIGDMMRDPERFSSKNMQLREGDSEAMMKMWPIMADPPEHFGYRMVLNKPFAPAPIKRMEGDIRKLAVELIDKVRPTGGCDVVRELSEPLPVFIFMQLMGLPLERFREFRDWAVGSLMAPNLAAAKIIEENVMGMFFEEVAKRRVERRDDLMSMLIDAEIDGRPITEMEIMSYCLMLFVAGLDTVVNGISFALRHLAIDHDLQEKLRADPSLIPDAIEEILRRYTFTSPPRRAAVDVTYDGVFMKKGDGLLMLLPAADLDAGAFPEPTEVKLGRSTPNMAFGVGMHRCVGSHLARLELKVVYEEWLNRIPTFSLDPDHPAHYHPAMVMAVDSLTLKWDAATA